MVAVKVVDDLKVTGEGDNPKNSIKDFDNKFKLGTVSQGTSNLRRFGMNTLQEDDFTVSINADDKLFSVTEQKLTKDSRCQANDTLNVAERSAYASINSSLGWLGIAASLLCATYALLLQKCAPRPTLLELIELAKSLKKLKRICIRISYPRYTDSNHHRLLVLVFVDASRSNASGQIGFRTGLLIDEIKKDSIFHAISQLSHKSKKSTRTVPAAETPVASEAVDHRKEIAEKYTELLNVDVRLQIVVDSKDLYDSIYPAQLCRSFYYR